MKPSLIPTLEYGEDQSPQRGEDHLLLQDPNPLAVVVKKFIVLTKNENEVHLYMNRRINYICNLRISSDAMLRVLNARNVKIYVIRRRYKLNFVFFLSLQERKAKIKDCGLKIGTLEKKIKMIEAHKEKVEDNIKASQGFEFTNSSIYFLFYLAGKCEERYTSRARQT